MAYQTATEEHRLCIGAIKPSIAFLLSLTYLLRASSLTLPGMLSGDAPLPTPCFSKMSRNSLPDAPRPVSRSPPSTSSVLWCSGISIEPPTLIKYLKQCVSQLAKFGDNWASLKRTCCDEKMFWLIHLDINLENWPLFVLNLLLKAIII